MENPVNLPWWGSSSQSASPINAISETACGIRPSPQVLSLGNSCLSRSSVFSPAFAEWYAAEEPPGPAPTTTRSYRSAIVLLLQVLPTVCQNYTSATTRRELGRPQQASALRGGGARRPESHRTARRDTGGETWRVRPRFRLQGARPRREARAALQPVGAGARSVGPE